MARSEQHAIEDFITRTAPGAKIEALDCRSTMCRLRVWLPDETALTAFRNQVGQPPLDRGGFFRMHPEKHTFSFVTPRARGHRFPTLLEPEPE